jgi:uncharacterized damage-inducible protein DinB
MNAEDGADPGVTVSRRETAALAGELQSLAEGEPWHGPALEALLDGVSASAAAARPIAGAHTAWELVLHLTGWTEVVRERLEGRAVDQPAAGDFPSVSDASERAWTEAKGAFRHAHGRLVDRVAALADADLESPVGARGYTVRFLLRGAIAHLAYHSGQIGLLRKAAA